MSSIGFWGRCRHPKHRQQYLGPRNQLGRVVYAYLCHACGCIWHSAVRF